RGAGEPGQGVDAVADGETVRCQDCGFLCCFDGQRRRTDTLTERERKSGVLPGYGGPNPTLPVCFVAAWPLGEECKTLGGSSATLTVITKDRHCHGFMELRPGLS